MFLSQKKKKNSENRTEAESIFVTPFNNPIAKKERISILKSEFLERANNSSNDSSRDSKKVRFSDIGESSQEDNNNNNNMSDSDIFFEAKESLDDEEDKENKSDNNSPVISSSTKLQTNKDDKKQDRVGVMDANCTAKTSSSRVVMMLVVEKTDSERFSGLDFAPLIDSGLKKLEQNSAIDEKDAGIVYFDVILRRG